MAYLVFMRAVKGPDTILKAHRAASMPLISDPYRLILIWYQIEEWWIFYTQYLYIIRTNPSMVYIRVFGAFFESHLIVSDVYKSSGSNRR